jgi:hypothetical protein
MKAFFLIVVLLDLSTLYGQAVLTVDRTEIRIGDQVRAMIRTDLSDGREWINVNAVWPDTLQGIEVVTGPEWNREDPNATFVSWNLALFDTGWVRIPSLAVIIQYQGQTDTQYTNDVPVMVLPVEPDSAGLRAIKPIFKQPFNPGYYKRYLPHLAIGLLILAGIVYWLNQRRKKKSEVVIIPLPPAPDEWAYKALEELAGKKLWQGGDIKEHYTQLTAILREYLERRFGIHALEQTSDEILHQLRLQHLQVSLLQDTEALLSVSDLIKFAKADPGIDIHAVTIERVRSFVFQTTPSESMETSDQIKNS